MERRTIFVSSIWNFLHVAIVADGNLWFLLDYWKNCVPLIRKFHHVSAGIPVFSRFETSVVKYFVSPRY